MLTQKDKQLLDATIDKWFEGWEKKENAWDIWSIYDCPFCQYYGPQCVGCTLKKLLGTGCHDSLLLFEIIRSDPNATEEILRHLLQIRLELFGDVGRWVE